MSKEEIKYILQKAEELATKDFYARGCNFDVQLTCMKIFGYLIKAMEEEK